MNQSEIEPKTCSRRQARENARFFRQSQKQSKQTKQLTFDTQLKSTLYDVLVIPFESMDEILKCNHSNESY